MKRIICLISALLGCLALGAQENAGDIKAEYERQVRYVGADGLGVETIINRWEAAAPDDPEVHVARFNYWLARSQARTEVKSMPLKKYLGREPVVTLKDSLGGDVNYFEDVVYDDEAFGEALKAVEKAISLKPEELSYRFYKITAVLDYEKDSPDMALEDIEALIRAREDYKGYPDRIRDVDAFLAYGWPGNIRELNRTVDRLHRSGKVDDDLSLSDLVDDSFLSDYF